MKPGFDDPTVSRLYGHRQAPALVGVLGGLLWLGVGWSIGWASVFTLPVGVLMLATATGAWLYAGDARLNHHLAVAGVFGVIFALVLSPVLGWWTIALLVTAVAAFWVSGWMALSQQPVTDAAPMPERSARLATKVALDNAMLGYFVATAKVPGGARTRAIASDTLAAVDLMDARGWRVDAVRFHVAPGLPDNVQINPARTLGQRFEHVQWPSAYAPHGQMPGAARYADYQPTHTAHAWMLRHDTPRPWMVAIHGYRMGVAAIDWSLFDPHWLHHRLGLNVLVPTLPLHGRRRIGRRSGDGFLEGEFTDLLHAQSQALFDLRAALAWLRAEQDAEQIGVLGFSLGGYNAALLSNFDADLDAVIAAIPLTDMAGALWRHYPELPRRSMEALGVDQTAVSRLLTPVSPLGRNSLIRRDRLTVIGGTADQLIAPDQIQALAGHWGVDEPVWYAGSHMSVRRERMVRYTIERALLSAGLVERDALGPRPLAHRS